MKVLAVHPSGLMYTRVFLRLEPLGLETVAAAVRQAGHDVRLIDLQVETHFSLGHTGSPEDVIVHRVRSTSFIASLPEAARVEIDDEVRKLIEREPELSGKREVTVPYETAAFVAIRQ